MVENEFGLGASVHAHHDNALVTSVAEDSTTRQEVTQVKLLKCLSSWLIITLTRLDLQLEHAIEIIQIVGWLTAVHAKVIRTVFNKLCKGILCFLRRVLGLKSSLAIELAC